MYAKIARGAAWYGPLALFAGLLACILYAAPRVPVPPGPAIPAWSFRPGIVQTAAGHVRPGTMHIRHDPFKARPVSHKVAEKLPVLELGMIVTVGQQSFCRINGVLYSQDDHGPGFKVRTIARSWVDVRLDDGRPYRIYLGDRPGRQGEGSDAS